MNSVSRRQFAPRSAFRGGTLLAALSSLLLLAACGDASLTDVGLDGAAGSGGGGGQADTGGRAGVGGTAGAGGNAGDGGGVGEALLTWTIPTTREDGTPLNANELARYEISHSTSSGGMETVRVDDPTRTSHRLSALSPGEYSFEIVAIDVDDRRSTRSNIASKTVVAQ